MDGSLIADTANAVASFANVVVTGALGYLVYRFTKQDEAGRIERAFENDRNLRREEWARERKARVVSPTLDLLAKLPGELLNVATFLDKPLAQEPFKEAVNNLSDHVSSLMALTSTIPNNELRLECATLAEMLNKVGWELALHGQDGRQAIPSWAKEVERHCMYLMNVTNNLVHEMTNWQDGEPVRPVDWETERPMPLARAQYPSLT